jgi:hypothetical protein
MMGSLERLRRLRRRMGMLEDDLPTPLLLPPRRRGGRWSTYLRNAELHQRLARAARASTAIDELFDVLDDRLSEWLIARQRPRDLRVALLREKRGRPRHDRLPPWAAPISGRAGGRKSKPSGER